MRLLLQQVEIEEVEIAEPQISALSAGVYKDFPRDVDLPPENGEKDPVEQAQ